MAPRKDHGCSSFLTSDGDQVSTRDVQGKAFSCGAVRGKGKNPRGRAGWGGMGRGMDENPRAGPGQRKKARKSTDPKNRQKCVKLSLLRDS